MVVCNNCNKNTDRLVHKDGEFDVRKYKFKDMVCLDCRIDISTCEQLGLKLWFHANSLYTNTDWLYNSTHNN